MEIVVLRGSSNSGKTTTLKKLILKILEEYGDESLKINPRKISKQKLINELEEERKGRLVDKSYPIRNITAVFKINECSIGITTVGDDVKVLSKAFSSFGDCELCFCATHEDGKTVEYVNNLAEDNLIIWYNQCKVIANSDYELSRRFPIISDKISDILFLNCRIIFWNSRKRRRANALRRCHLKLF